MKDYAIERYYAMPRAGIIEGPADPTVPDCREIYKAKGLEIRPK